MPTKRDSTIVLALSLTLTALLYGRALNLAFVNDDIAHVLALQRASIADIFLTQWAAHGAAYYRPLGSLLLWMLLRLSPSSPEPFYALSLLLHALNGWLLWSLVRRRMGPWSAAGAALAWLLFPTHYEAVAYVAALFHPVSTTLILLAMLSLDAALAMQRRWLWWCVALLVMLAPFAHEQAAVLPALILLWQFLFAPPDSVRAWLRSRIPWLLLLILPVLALRAVLGGTLTDAIVPDAANTFAGLRHLSRLVAYPFAWFDGGVLDAQGQALLGLLLVLGLLWFGLCRRRAAPALLGLGWLLVTAAPSVLLLDTSFLPSSPRLAYLPSIGIALLWSSLLSPVASPVGRVSWLRASLVGTWTLLLCLAPLPYIHSALVVLEESTGVVEALVSVARELAPSERALVINAPFYYVAPCSGLRGRSPAYPYEYSSVVVLPLYAQIPDLVRANGGPEREIQAVSWAELAPGWATRGPDTSALAIRGALEAGTRVLVVQMDGGRVDDLTTAWAQRRADTFSSYLQLLETPRELASSGDLEAAQTLAVEWDGLSLVGISADQARLPGEELPVSLYWRAAHASTLSGKDVQMRLVDRYGNVLIEQKRAVLPGYVPSLWQSDATYATRWQISVPANAALGPARLEIALAQAERTLYSVQDAGDSGGWIAVADVLLGRPVLADALDANAMPVDARWENGITLEGLLLNDQSSSNALRLVLYWRADQPVTEDLVVFVHLVAASGVVAQSDGEPAGGQFPTSCWPAGALVADEHTLEMIDAPPGANLSLLVGLYRWPSLERLSVVTADGTVSDHVVLTQIGATAR